MFEVGKKYKVRDLDYFAKHSRDFSYDSGGILSRLTGTSHFMTSSMLRKKRSYNSRYNERYISCRFYNY